MYRIKCGLPGISLFDVESKEFPDVVKVAQKRASTQIQIEDVRCDTVQAKSVEIHVTYI